MNMATGEHMTVTVGSELLNEIERVTAKRERWKGYQAEGLGSSLDFAMALMTVAIERGKSAIAASDPVECIAAMQELRGFDTDD